MCACSLIHRFRHDTSLLRNSTIRKQSISAYALALVLQLPLIMASLDSASAAIVVNGYSHATNDRFTNSPSFYFAAVDLSGVGQTSLGFWATAISPNVIISAHHRRPSGAVYFYEGNDPGAIPVVRSVVSGQQIGSTDLYIAVLDSPLPSSIAYYNYAVTPIVGGDPETIVSAGIYDDEVAILTGLSPFDVTTSPLRENYNDQAFGANRIGGYVENVDFLGLSDVDALLFINDSFGSPDFVTYESRLLGGASGAPAFLRVGNELLLLGINSFTFTLEDFNPAVTGSGASYVGNHALTISSYISLHAVSPVPEPGLAQAAWIGLIGLLLNHHRKRYEATQSC